MAYEKPIGQPIPGGNPKQPSEPEVSPLTEPDAGGRGGDEGGRRKSEEIDQPRQTGKIGGREIDALAPEPPRRDLQVSDLLIPKVLKVPAFFRSKAWFLAVAFVVSVIVLFVLSHAISVARDVLEMPSGLMWFTVGLLALITIVIGYVLGRGLWCILKLSRGFQLEFKQLRSFEDESGERAYAIAKDKFLTRYVRDLSKAAKGASSTHFRLLGAEVRDDLVDAAEMLLDPDWGNGSRAWTKEYLRRIQDPLEKAALASISRYAKLVGAKTAISPWPLIDIASVIYNATRMISEVALLFNHRFSRFDTFRILLDIMMTIYVSGEIEEAIEAVSDEKFGEAGPEDGASIPEAGEAFRVIGGFLRKGIGKLGEGAANYLLMKRLGKRAVKMLKPIL